MCALRNRVSHHTVDSRCGQQQRDGSKNAQQYKIETGLRHRFTHHILHGSDIGNRLRAIDVLDRLSHRCGNRLRLDWSSNNGRHSREGVLKLRGIYFGRRSLLQLQAAYVGRDSDYFEPDRLFIVVDAAEVYALADRVLTRKIAVRGRLIYQFDQWSREIVTFFKRSTLDNRNGQRAKVIRTYTAVVGGRPLIDRKWLAPLNAKTKRRPFIKRQRVYCADRVDAGNRTDSFFNLFVVCDVLRVFTIVCSRGIQSYGQDLLRVEPGVDRLEPEKAAKQQPGADQ